MSLNRLLLTGAAGALGGVLREGLAAHAAKLRLSDIEPVIGLSAHEELVIADLADTQAMLELTRDVDAVVHMGGMAHEHTFETILHSNIVGLYNIYEGCRKNGVARVVWGSSNHAIGFYPRTQVIDANVPTRPDSNYGISKAFGENVAQYYWDKYGVESVSIRIGSCRPEPEDRRMLTTWLSYPDLVHLVERALLAPRVEHTVVYGMSNNDMSVWDNRRARHLGYVPRDNAESFREKVEASQPLPDKNDPFVAVHGGGFAGAAHFED